MTLLQRINLKFGFFYAGKFLVKSFLQRFHFNCGYLFTKANKIICPKMDIKFSHKIFFSYISVS